MLVYHKDGKSYACVPMEDYRSLSQLMQDREDDFWERQLLIGKIERQQEKIEVLRKKLQRGDPNQTVDLGTDPLASAFGY